MRNFEVHRELAQLISAVNAVTTAAIERAPATEVELRVDRCFEICGRLERLVDGNFERLRRHLWWLHRRHREGLPSAADGDVADLRERDMLEVIDAVEKWSAGSLDARLVAAIQDSWDAQRYDAAVREAFVFTETEMRTLGDVAPAQGITGRRLVNRLIPGNGPSDRWSDEGLLGQLTEAEQAGARDLLNGAVSLFRNATAHRDTGYTRDEATDIVHLVNLCLRLLAKYEAPDSHDAA